jgi:hypothetical protein
LKEFEQKYGEPLANAKPEDMLRYQAILRGDMPMPSPRSVGGQKTADAVLALAQQQGDTYTENRYLTRKAFKNGTDAQQLQNLTTALGHAERGLDNSTNLGFNPTVGTRFPTTGAAAYGQDVELGSAELAKLAAAGAITEGDHQRLAKDLRDTREGVRNAAWKEMIDLVGSRVQGMEQKFKTGTGQDINPAEFYSPQTQQRMRRFGIGRVAETPATGTGVPTSTSAAAPQTHKVGDTVNLKGGRTAKVTAVYPDGTFDAQ